MAKETVIDNFEFQEVLKANIENLKREKDLLDRNMFASNINLKKNEEALIRQKSEFESWKAGEIKKTETQKNQILNSLINQQEQSRVNEENLKRRDMEMKQRELSALKIEDERKKLVNKMIEVEQTAGLAKQELDKATQMKTEAQSKINLALVKETEADKKFATVQTKESEFHSREDALTKLTEETNLKLSNVEAVRKEITPKLEELKTTELSNKNLLEEINRQKVNIEAKLKEDKDLMKMLMDKEAKLSDMERQAVTKLEEANRRLLLAQRKENGK